jgi:hypothetical protein
MLKEVAQSLLTHLDGVCLRKLAILVKASGRACLVITEKGIALPSIQINL